MRVALWLLGLFLVSCSSGVAFVSVFDMPRDRVWSRQERVEFLFTPTDTLSEHRIDLILRHGRDFRFGELMLEITTRTPELLYWTDTVKLKLTDANNEWVGRNFDTHYDFGINYRRAVKFETEGEYVIKIKHLEPKDSLSGVMALGLIIEKDGKE